VPYFLGPDHSAKALRAIDAFLETYLLDWCGLDVLETSNLLFHRVELFGGSQKLPMSTPLASLFKDRTERLGLKMRYLDPHFFSATLSHGPTKQNKQ
jgi:hypothetical protein